MISSTEFELSYVEPEIFESVFHHLSVANGMHSLLIGGAGSGKTALIKRLKSKLEKQGHLVILISMRSAISFESFIARLASSIINEFEHSFGVDAADREAFDDLRAAYRSINQSEAILAFDRIFEALSRMGGGHGRTFVFLDGLDEVAPFSDSLFGIRTLEWMAGVSPSHGAILVASRAMGYLNRAEDVMGRLKIFNLNGVPNVAIREIIRRLPGAGSLSPQVIDQAVAVSHGLPLMAILIAQQAISTGSLPDVTDSDNSLSLKNALLHSLTRFEAEWENRHEFWSLSIVCWAMEEVSISYLAQVTGLSTMRTREWVEKAEKYSFVRVSADVVKPHDLLRMGIESKLIPNEIDVAALDFGDESAERDGLLSTSFRHPPEIPAILDGSKTIVLGDRGAGKSAIFRSLCMPATAQTPSNIFVATAGNSSDFLQRMGAANDASAERFKAIWLLYVAAFAARELQDHSNLKTTQGQRFRSDAHRLLRNLGQENDIREESFRTRFVAPLRALLPRKLSFTVGPIKIEQEFMEGGKPSKAMDVDVFIRRTEALLQQIGSRLVVVVDKIDEANKYDRSLQEQLIQGLLMAEAALSHTQCIRLVVLLRTDLFEIFHIQEKNKFVSRTVRLAWTEHQLAIQLLTRAYSNEQLKPAFDILRELCLDDDIQRELQFRVLFPKAVDNKAFWYWLYNSLAGGNNRVSPRQIVLFMNLLKEEAKNEPRVKRIPLYSEVQVKSALIKISGLCFQELIDDFKVATALIQNCRAGKKYRLSFADVTALCDPAEGTPATQIDQLLRLGFFERVVTEIDGKLQSELRVAALFIHCWD